ncbi:MAG: hypothetical protein SGARI_003467 [Bacillariaceae sp.]
MPKTKAATAAVAGAASSPQKKSKIDSSELTKLKKKHPVLAELLLLQEESKKTDKKTQADRLRRFGLKEEESFDDEMYGGWDPPYFDPNDQNSSEDEDDESKGSDDDDSYCISKDSPRSLEWDEIDTMFEDYEAILEVRDNNTKDGDSAVLAQGVSKLYFVQVDSSPWAMYCLWDGMPDFDVAIDADGKGKAAATPWESMIGRKNPAMKSIQVRVVMRRKSTGELLTIVDSTEPSSFPYELSHVPKVSIAFERTNPNSKKGDAVRYRTTEHLERGKEECGPGTVTMSFLTCYPDDNGNANCAEDSDEEEEPDYPCVVKAAEQAFKWWPWG